MRGKTKLIRSERDGFYTVLVRNYFWQKWKPLLDDNGRTIRFKTFKEFREITKIESFGKITITLNDFQGM